MTSELDSSQNSTDSSLKRDSISNTKSISTFTDFDSVFDVVGGFGPYQIFLGILSQWSCFLLAANTYMMSFGNLEPVWHCDAYPANQSTDHCSFLHNCTDSNGTSLLKVDSQFYSVVQQWELTCDKDYIPNMITSIQMLGYGFGNPAGGHLADYLGRKWLIVAGWAMATVSGSLFSIAPSWQVLTVFMFCIGFAFGLCSSARYVLSMELTGKKYRLIMSCFFTWCVAFQIAALIAFLVRSWRIYAITVNGLCLPLVIIAFFIDESPRWLIQKKKYEKACVVLNKVAKWNNKKEILVPEQLKTIHLDQRKSTSYSILSLFSSKRLAIYSFICFISSFISASVSGVILFNVGHLVGSPFLNIALYGMLRMWVPPFMVLMEKYSSLWFFGRRPMFLCSLAFVILCFIGITVIYSTNTTNQNWLIVATALALAGSCINASLYDTAVTLYITELFPTVIRAIAFSTMYIADNIGSISAPQLLYLQKYWKQLPYVFLASIASLAWVMAFFILPETVGRPLPDNLDDIGEKVKPSENEETDEKIEHM